MKCIYDNFRIIKDESKIETKKVVVAFNETADRVNKILHKGEPYYVGLEIICKIQIINKFKRLFKGEVYTIVELTEKYPIITDGDKNYTITYDELKKNFKYNHAITTHSAQGQSIEEAITICDGNSFMATNEWLYTAVSRTTDLDNITFCFHNQFVKDLTSVIQNRLLAHRHEDIAKKRKFDLTTNWVWEKLKSTNYSCCRCHKHLDVLGNEAWSIDRVDNILGHLQMNCQIICRNCNVSKK